MSDREVRETVLAVLEKAQQIYFDRNYSGYDADEAIGVFLDDLFHYYDVNVDEIE